MLVLYSLKHPQKQGKIYFSQKKIFGFWGFKNGEKSFLKKILKNLKKGIDFSVLCDIISFVAKDNSSSVVGVDGVEGPPVPIPNTVVKLNCAEDT